MSKACLLCHFLLIGTKKGQLGPDSPVARPLPHSDQCLMLIAGIVTVVTLPVPPIQAGLELFGFILQPGVLMASVIGHVCSGPGWLRAGLAASQAVHLLLSLGVPRLLSLECMVSSVSLQELSINSSPVPTFSVCLA